MFVTAVKSYQHIRNRIYDIMLHQHVFKNVYKLSCFGVVYTWPFDESSWNFDNQ